MQTEDYIYGKDMYKSLKRERPRDMYETDWNVLDRNALSVVCLSLSLNVILNIAKEMTTAS